MFQMLPTVTGPIQANEAYSPIQKPLTLSDVAALLEGVELPVMVSLASCVEYSLQLEGFSSRDDYRCLALSPAELTTDAVKNTVLSSKLSAWLREQVGSTLYGYKGGEFVLEADTPLFVGHEGYTGFLIFAVYAFEDHIRMFARRTF